MLLASLAFAAASLSQATATSQTVAPDPTWEPHRKLEILYAGSPNGSREVAWVDFLKQWFDEVEVISLLDLSKAAAADYDVVIADWRSHYGNDGYSKDPGKYAYPELPDDFDRPIIALDYVASRIRRKGKLDWL